jgi:ABC-type multidrug transport system ATPase subunit
MTAAEETKEKPKSEPPPVEAEAKASADAKEEAKAEAKADAKAEAKADAKTEAKADAKEEAKTAPATAKTAEAPKEPAKADSPSNPYLTGKEDGKPEVEYKKKGKKKKEVEIAVRLTQVTKRFGPKTAVDGVTIKIKAGTVYGLIGPNGAGKTTTFSMMAGYLKPTEGAIEMLGYAPTAVDELRSRVGVLPQDAILPASDTVGEFLLHMALLQDIPKDKAETAAREVLAEVDGRDWWKLRCSSLSHGMAKRVALAQALMGEPEVVLLDEPTAGLDPRIAYEVRQIVKARRGRCTLIVSSHNLQELEEICDGAVILDRGRVIAQGTITELTAASEEVHIKLAPMVHDHQGGAPSLSAAIAGVRDLPMVKRVEFDEEKYELVVYFERKVTDAETVIGAALWVLLNHRARISGVTKGRGLEQRVMELT